MKVLLLSLAALVCCYSQTCTQTFTPQNVGTSPYPGSNVNNAIKNGNGSTVLCFAAGSYGEIDVYAARPSGVVTLTPAPGASGVILGHINFNGVSNVKINGFNGSHRVSGGFVIVNASQGNSSNITFTNNDMGSSGILVRDNTQANANILIANNKITGFRPGNGYEPAMIVVNTVPSACPNGVTFQNNHVNGSAGDGMGTAGSACGTRFIGNKIEGFMQSSCGSTHCDGFQDNGGGRQTLLESNYFYNNTVCFGLYDGSSEITIKNNVCVTSPDSHYWMQFGGSKTITLDHNTVKSASGAQYGNDHRGNPSANVTFINNIFPSQPTQNAGQPVSGFFVSNYNMCPNGCTGANSIKGSPTFAGGSSLLSFSDYALSSTSLGRNSGSDGKNIGIISAITSDPEGNTPPAPPTQLSAIVK
jgi:hypothetical protein